MFKRALPLMVVVVLVATMTVGASQAQARHRTSPDLFYNYYVGPGACECGGVGAQLYVSPRPAPQMVGHTWVTYQPLMPHEYMYRHKRCYVRRNPGAGLTFTKVCYGRHGLQAIVPTWMDGKIMKHLLPNPFCGYGKYYTP